LSRRRSPDAPIFLVGFMGVGKTAIGRALATRLGWAFEDTDALVVQHGGCPIEEIFRRSGEGRFRELEWGALRSLEGRSRVVVATGGGLFLGLVQRAYVRNQGLSCWLDAPLALVIARLSGTTSRPLWPVDDPIARRAFYERRRATYALADLRVDVSAGSPADRAEAVEAARSAFLR
jgi:shikimate kinase